MQRATSAALYHEAKPKAKEYTISDGKWQGLQMVVSPTGSKQWEFRYRLHGRRRKISVVGGYPRVDVKTARTWAEKWTQMVGSGLDPAEERKRERITAQAKEAADERTFRKIAEVWLDQYARTKPLADVSRAHIQARFNADVFPAIGARRIDEVTAGDIEGLMDGITRKVKGDKAHRILWHCRAVFAYAIEKGLVQKDPTFNKQRLLPAVKIGNRSALLETDRVAKLLYDIDMCKSGISVRYALRLIPHLFVRPTECREARWCEFDMDHALWDIPAERMKGRIMKRRSHLVPLSRQVMDLLKELRAVGEESEFLFPSPWTRLRPISSTSMLKALRVMGYTSEEQTIQGFRALARTKIDEVLRVHPDVIEAQLSHVVKNSNGTSYIRALYLESRQQMMQRWSDYLDELKAAYSQSATVS